MGAREVLNELKWGGKDELGGARVTILHRGAPGDRMVLNGSDIVELGSGFMRVLSQEGEVQIPYHRVTRIEVENRVKYERIRV